MKPNKTETNQMNNLTDKECDAMTDNLLRQMTKAGLLKRHLFPRKGYSLTKKGREFYGSHPMHPQNMAQN